MWSGKVVGSCMVRRFGTDEAQSLFGSGRADLIHGLGGFDYIQGNGGNDTLAGGGTVYGNAGDDLYSGVRFLWDYLPTAIFKLYTLDLGAGNDRFVVNDQDGRFGDGNYVGLGDLTLGAGADRAIIAACYGTTLALGTGADTAYVLSDAGARVQLADGFLQTADGSADVVHFDGHGDALALYGFGREDRLILYDTGLSLAQIRQRTTFLDPVSRTDLRITLPNETVITISKAFSGHLTPDMLGLTERRLVVGEEIVLGAARGTQNAVFAGGADDVLTAAGRALFLGGGDDIGRGGRRADSLYGETGDDTLRGQGGNDSLWGESGDDVLSAGAGADLIDTGSGADMAFGAAGADTFVIRFSGDTLSGGAGDDRFVFSDYLGSETARISGGQGRDVYVVDSDTRNVVVTDFRPGTDRIDISLWFTGTPKGPEAEARFRAYFSEGQLVTQDDFYPATGLYVSMFSMTWVFEGLKPGDLDRQDFILF